MKTNHFIILSKSPIFRGLDPAEVERLLSRVKFRVRKFSPEAGVAYRGDSCEELLIILRGSIRGEMLDYSGKTVQVETVSAPRPLAPAFVFGKKNRFPVDVIANGELEILALPKPSLVQLLQADGRVLTNFLNAVSNRTHFLSERLWFMSFKTIKEKLAQYILMLAKNSGEIILLPKSQQELSEFFGVARPSLSRVMGEMEREGIIQCNRKEIRILDRERLQALLQ